MARAPAVEAQALEKRYGSVRALESLTLTVPHGAVFGLVGPNGAGKTTFIKTLLGIARPDGGEVTVLGGSPDDVEIRARIGYLPENLQIPRHLDAFGLLRSVARLRGLTRSTLRSTSLDGHIEATLHRVGLERAAWRRPAGGWSKGMRQRAGLASALLGAPALLVLDEPTDGIDPLGRAAIRDVIREVASEGTTIFLNSHLLAESELICDRVAILARGRVVLDGDLAELRTLHRTVVRLTAGDQPEQVVAVAVAAGFVRDPPTDQPGLLGFSLEGVDGASLPALMMPMLRQVLDAGIAVAEISRPKRTLEEIMASVVERDT